MTSEFPPRYALWNLRGPWVSAALLKQVERLKGLIRTAERDSSAWLHVLSELARALGARTAAVYAPPYQGRPLIPFLLHNLDLAPIANRLGAYTNRAPFLHRAIERGLVPGVFTDREVYPLDELRKDAYYDDILVPLRWHDSLQVVPRAPSSSEAGLVFSFVRYTGEDEFGAEAARLAQILLPVLAECARDYFVARTDGAPSQAFRALDGFSTPCVVVTLSGRCVYANSAAQRLLNEDLGVGLRNGVLTAGDAKNQKQLQDAIQQAAAATADSESIELRLSPDGAAPLLAIISPLPGEERAARMEELPCAAIYLIQVESIGHFAAQARRARGLFNLTTAESEILSLFLAGRPLSDIAEQRRTATITVRTQLKSIMHKTHSHHQLDLLRFRRLAP